MRRWSFAVRALLVLAVLSEACGGDDSPGASTTFDATDSDTDGETDSATSETTDDTGTAAETTDGTETSTETGAPETTETSGDGDGDGDGDPAPGFCGDGIVSDAEVCDDGINDGSYGGCNPDCLGFGPYCGDALVNGPEGCDDGNDDPTDGCLGTCVVAHSCASIHEAEPNLADGFYTLSPEGLDGDPFQVYCDMSTDGGGWAVIFKNHGGSVPGEVSNDALLDGDPGPYVGVIVPHGLELVSGVNAAAWDWYRDAPGHEWLKVGTLYSPQDAIVHEQLIRVELGEVTWSWILSRPSSEYCHLAPNPIVLTANGDVSLGQTTYVNSYQADRRTFGLASSGAAPEDRCGQADDNLINDPQQVLAWIQGYSMGGIRHLFSYVHISAGQDASRCQFACWNDDSAGYYDGFTWLVR